MIYISHILIALGVLTLIIGGFIYVLFWSKFKEEVAHSDPGMLFDLGMDTPSDLLGSSRGAKKTQNFFLKRLYLEHPDPNVVRSANKVFIAIIIVIAGLLDIVFGVLVYVFFSS